MTDQPAPEGDTDRVDLTLPNEGDYVALARFAAGVVAVRAGFDLEEVQDLQLAVDEMYSVERCTPGGRKRTDRDLAFCFRSIDVARLFPAV